MKIGSIETMDLRQELSDNGGYAWRGLGDINLLVIHHSGVAVDSLASRIAAYHRDSSGWPGIGYHFLVHWDGRTEYVGDILTVRYHAGPRNGEAIGVCLTGNFDLHPPGEVQLRATRDLLANLQFALGRRIPIVGHHELMATACPGDTFLRKEPFWGRGWREEGEVEKRELGLSVLASTLHPPPCSLSPHGVHWRNDPWRVEEADFPKFALGGFDWVTTICYPGLPPDLQASHLGVYRRLREINPRVQFVVRLNLSGPVKSSEFVAAFAPRIAELREFTDRFQIHNEPNHPGEHFGGASDGSAWRYRWWHQRVVEGLKDVAPWAKLGFPALAVRQREEAWLDICAPAIEMSDFLGWHVYWQYDNWASPDWGGRYALAARAFPSKQIYITEYGDSTPGRSMAEKARIYAQWLKTVRTAGPAASQIRAACAFILSSPDPAWSEFVLDQEACLIVADKTGKG